MKAKMARKLAMLVAMNGLLSNSESEEIESEISELERLARIGRAAEKALAIDGMNAYIYEETGFEYDITNVEELIKWAESED